MPKVSIITPIFCDTSAKVDWLDEMIASVLRQTLTDWELILIDDESPTLIDSVRGKYTGDSRLRWFKNAHNFGTAKTRNTAVALAESDCILPLDSDDMLANNEALEMMYDAWIVDKSKIIYGDIQFLTPVTPTTFKLGKVIQLAGYSIENAMDLRGAMPVTCMHSIACHQNAIAEVAPGVYASGWKSVLQYGREDVEYWIAAGKRGYCGQKINHTTLVYRKHQGSRDYNLKKNNQLDGMQMLIKKLHADVYSGRFPMACCGKGGANAAQRTPDPLVMSQQAQSEQVRIVTTLDGYPEEDLEWVAYQGPKKGRFGSILTRDDRKYPAEYPVFGTGHYFQIHKRHKPLFEQRQHLHFRINVSDPREQQKEEEEMRQSPPITPEPEPELPDNIQPELATLERLDRTAAQTRTADVQIIQNPQMPTIEEVIMEPNPPQSISVTMESPQIQMPPDYLSRHRPLEQLGLSEKLTDTLERNSFTINSLAHSTPEKVAALPGFGPKRSKEVIEKAQELINNT